MSVHIVFIVLVAAAAFLYILYCLRRPNSLSLPPGPPRDPLIGHLRYIPSTNRAAAFHEWAKIYGDIMYLDVLGNPMIVLNTEKIAVDLLNKRSSIYSDRPRFILYEMIGWSTTLSLMPYGKRFAAHRQLHRSYLNRTKCREFRPVQTLEARTLVKNLLDAPPATYSDFINRQEATIVAGHRISSDDDPYMRTTQALRESLGRSGVPGCTSLDFLPFLRYLPAWFPGFPFGTIARECRPPLQRLYDFPLQTVQGQMASQHESGVARPSFLLTQLERIRENPEPRNYDDIKWAAAAMFGSTIWSSVTVFILAMLLHPEYQVKAQKEIDSVVGQSRLPDFEDRQNLPLVECIVQETLRWHPPTELGVPHRLMEDDLYHGMFIPKGIHRLCEHPYSAMSLDESIYSSPKHFFPERFLPKPTGSGEPHFASAYGFGRRVCSGQHLADQSLWIAIASILAACTISNAYDERGNAIVPEAEDVMSDGVSSHPNDFPCVISCRDAHIRAVVLESVLDED
ncbi:O-methylsterigmatocystin oxidoreductase [Mycena venus]|uniref:O-methylsterigmatocystin oxidoreductase n=1 Tax=Mycena venus TaxID=2733690 RepID=A0A8H7D430_9AGAR|nr:O-methylsterigmatocystin oxidoreductase [Mycena venus]